MTALQEKAKRREAVEKLAANACKRRGLEVKPAATSTGRCAHSDGNFYTVDALIKELLKCPSQARVCFIASHSHGSLAISEVRVTDTGESVFLSNPAR